MEEKQWQLNKHLKHLQEGFNTMSNNHSTLELMLQARVIKESLDDAMMLVLDGDRRLKHLQGKPLLTSCERDNIKVGLDKVEGILKAFTERS